MSGKGSRPRPMNIDLKTFDKNWENIFKKDKVMTEKKGTCGCGRSPTGDCIGWHSLTEEQYKEKLLEWQSKDVKDSIQEG